MASSAGAPNNPNHPATTVLGDLDLPEHLLLDYPRQIALLLPLSGSAASAGQAVQNGFLGAYFATASGLDDRQSVRIYDVNAEGGASAAYAAAVADGAEFVVGPLLRRNVTELANDILVPVPVLTLNYLPEGTLGTTRPVPVRACARRRSRIRSTTRSE